ncbi:uncharacterized protein UHOD_01114 [Ustilago sp. UG-2017b]|nr:uncharacterized protein UHOD_01114 [Ustilago sp. UG-2017b]
MNGRLRSSVDERLATAQGPGVPSTQPLRIQKHTQATQPIQTPLQAQPAPTSLPIQPIQPALERLNPTSRLESPAGHSGYSSPSNYPSPSPGPYDDSSRPESSAQGAACFGGVSPNTVPGAPHRTFSDLSVPMSSDPSGQGSIRFGAVGPKTVEPPQHQTFSDLSSNDPQPRAIHHTNDTFGRTSGKSALSDSHSTSASRRKASPTEKSAFGYLASSWIQPTSLEQNDEITECLIQDSGPASRQKSIDALQKELNLSGSSDPTMAPSLGEDDEEMWNNGAIANLQRSASAAQQQSNPAWTGVSGSDETPDQTFGRPSQERSQRSQRSQPTHQSSGDSRPGQEDSRPSHSHSDTTSSRDTDRSHNAAYGVGEAGGDEQFAVLTRTLTPDQRRQQEELGRMSQQRNSLTSPASTYTPLPPQLAATSPGRANQRASRQSNATIMATSITAGSISFTSSSTPRHDARLSRQTQGTSSSSAARPLSTGEQQNFQSTHGTLLFVGETADSDSQDSLDLLNNSNSPLMAQGMTSTRSASVRVKTPMFGNTLADLPPDQRASMVGALHDESPPFPSQGSIHGGFVNLNRVPKSQSGLQQQSALYDPAVQQQGQAGQQQYAAAQPRSQTRTQTQTYIQMQQLQPDAQQQYEQTRGYYAQPGDQTANVDHGFVDDNNHATGNMEGGARTPHLPNLGDMYAVAPKFPAAPYGKFCDVRLSSRLARVHHTILPLLTYAHIPATLFLDYNVIFALVQIALHPDSAQSGFRAAWWIATGVYGGCVLVWLVGVVILYEWLWSYRRRWTISQPLVMPIYLSSPAFVRTAIRDYSLYSLLYRARSSGDRRDALIESFWYYSQNWPTVLTLLPRGVISVILLVLYKPSGPTLTTQSQRDIVYFDRITQRLTQFAFILIIIQASWAAWKLAVLLLAYIGLAATLGLKSLIKQEQVQNAVADTEMTSFAGHSRRGLVAKQYLSQPGGGQVWMQDGEAIQQQQASYRRWAWRWRAEDRIRTILFDAGVLHQSVPTQDWHRQHEHEHLAAHGGELAGDRTMNSIQAPLVAYAQPQGGTDYGQQGQQPRDWFGPSLNFSESQTGLAITAPEAVQPEEWANSPDLGTNAGVMTAMPLGPASQAFHVQHDASSPSDDGNNSDTSDPYSPAPLPIGRSPRSKEQLRDASSISSRNDRASMRASSTSSLNRLAALNAAPTANRSSSTAVEGAATPASDEQGSTIDFRPTNAAPIVTANGRPARTPPTGADPPAQSANGTPLLNEWRGRKRPRSSPVLAYFPGLNPGGMVTETEDWIQHQMDEEDDQDDDRPDQRRNPAELSKKPVGAFDNDRRVMHTFVPMPSSFAMSKDLSLAGSPDQGGSDTKHGSWIAAAPNPEMFAVKPAAAGPPPSTPPLRQQVDAPNTSTTSLGSSVKGRRSGTYSRPRSPGHGHEASSEDGISFDGGEGNKKWGRNSLLGKMTTYSSSESSRRSGSGGRPEGESWLSSLFSRKVSAGAAGSSSPQVETSPAMQPSTSTPRSESGPEMDAVPTLITTSASTSLPTADSGGVQQNEAQPATSTQEPVSGSLLLVPIGDRSPSPVKSNASGNTDDSEEGRLWASFPNQSRRHPPGLIALDIEQRTIAERRLAAAANENNAAMQQHRLLYGPTSSGPVAAAQSLSGTGINLLPLMHPNVLAAISGGVPGVAQLIVSPSEGGLHAIREESWSSSLDSRSQGATGSTRSRGTASAVTASPVDADFPLEQIEEAATPHPIGTRGSNGRLRRGSS